MPLRLAALLLACLPLTMAAQQDAVRPASPPPADTAVFRSESELVVLHVTVRDGRGEYVNGLQPDAFRLFENDRAQEVSVFTHQDDPVTIGLIIDTSGSMQATRNRVAYAASQFAHAGHPDDEIFALVVGDEIRAVLPPERPFTNDAVVLQESIAAALAPGGRTALYDAIDAGLDYLSRGSHERRALVILSDGIDTASELSFSDVLLRTQASNAAIYAIVLVDPIQVQRDPGRLKPLARASGGEAYFPNDHIATFKAMEQVARDIRNAYAIGFVPRTSHDGRYHSLKVNVTPPAGMKVHVRTRAGYLAGKVR